MILIRMNFQKKFCGCYKTLKIEIVNRRKNVLQTEENNSESNKNVHTDVRTRLKQAKLFFVWT